MESTNRHIQRISLGKAFGISFLFLSAAQFHFAANFHKNLQERQLSASSVEVPTVRDFDAGLLNVEPTHYKRCATVRFRGDPTNYTMTEAVALIQEKEKIRSGRRALSMGIEFVESPERFFPVRISETTKTFHMFHMVELLVVAYAELHQLAEALPQHQVELGHGATKKSTLERGSPSISVPWILAPHMAPSEICGQPLGINCLIADLVLGASNASIFGDQSRILGLHAMENVEYETQAERKDKAVQMRMRLARETYSGIVQQEHEDYFAQTDGVLLVERFGCDAQGINKPWARYINDFPAEKWHADVQNGVGLETSSQASKKKIVVGYIDRQSTTRRLHDNHHLWIVEYLSNHAQIDFKHLHMENYAASEQVKISTQCDVLIGVHGNGLTHSLWMKPRRYVIEIFWMYAFQFDYVTAAQLMQHSYLGIQNGKVLDHQLIAQRNPSLRRDKIAQSKANVTASMDFFEREGKTAISDLIDIAIGDLL